MGMKETLAIIATVLAIIGNVSYLKNVIKGKIIAHPYTWFVWSIVSAVTFFGGLQKGAGIGALPTGVAEGFTILIFIFSLKYVFGKHKTEHIKRVDTYFLITALLGIIPWIITRDPTVSIIVVVCIDLVAFVPTLRKTWFNPETEKPTLYEMNIARHTLTLLALQTYNIATTLHSVVMICINAVMVGFVRRGK